MPASYKVTGDAAFLKLLEDIKKKAPGVLQQFVWVELALFAEREIKDRTPVDLGRLKGSIGHAEAPASGGDAIFETGGGGGGAIWVTLGTNVEYASWIEEGTKPHKISAKNVKFLKFQSGGATVFAKTVNHPGTRAYAMFEQGLKVTEAKVDQMLKRRLATMGFV